MSSKKVALRDKVTYLPSLPRTPDVHRRCGISSTPFGGLSFIDFKIRLVSEYGSPPGVLDAWGVLGAVHALHFRILEVK